MSLKWFIFAYTEEHGCNLANAIIINALFKL